jgi:hypothetical protein
MTIDQAVNELFESEEFKRASKKDAYLRNRLSRHRRGELKSGAKVELLITFGYTITAKKTVIKRTKS